MLSCRLVCEVIGNPQPQTSLRMDSQTPHYKLMPVLSRTESPGFAAALTALESAQVRLLHCCDAGNWTAAPGRAVPSPVRPDLVRSRWSPHHRHFIIIYYE